MEKRAPIRPGDYSIGFLKLLPDNIIIIGSGTLVREGNLHGIITAAHVWRAVQKLEVVGFYQYPARRREIQSLQERTDFLSAVSIGEMDDELGPDIAFVRLPAPTVSRLSVHSSFVNMERSAAAAFMKPPAGATRFDAVAGMIEEWKPTETYHGKNKTIKSDGLLNLGATKAIEDGRDSFDRLEFTPVPDSDFELPKSYGGTSGGGCLSGYDTSEGPVGFHLRGVAFFEKKKAGVADTIICHGPQSIYQKLWPSVRARWPDEGT